MNWKAGDGALVVVPGPHEHEDVIVKLVRRLEKPARWYVVSVADPLLDDVIRERDLHPVVSEGKERP